MLSVIDKAHFVFTLISEINSILNVMVLGLNSANQFKETFVSISLLIVAKKGKKIPDCINDDHIIHHDNDSRKATYYEDNSNHD